MAGSKQAAAVREPLHGISRDILRAELTASLLQNAPPVAQEILRLFDDCAQATSEINATEIRKLQTKFCNETQRLLTFHFSTVRTAAIYPRRSGQHIREYFTGRLLADIEAAFERVRLRASLKETEKIEILIGMLRTRHLDARLKKFFTGSEITTPAGTVFQGKGFRSMGQEAIYAAAIRLKRSGPATGQHSNNAQRNDKYAGDFVAIMIRDLGLALAMGITPFDVMAAQMGKPGRPTYGKDLHIGDLSSGVLPPAAPIALSTGNAIGLGLALKGSGRVVINCNGEGGTSSGEWHEAINFATVQNLPIVFIVQNNQTALSTPTNEQFRCLNLASKAQGYGMRAITIDGTDPEAVFAAVTEAAETCRSGYGPVMVELTSMRMCGHAHHDDMLYFGEEPDQFLDYPECNGNGYADPGEFAFWKQKDPIATYKQKLVQTGVLTEQAYARLIMDVQTEIEDAAQRVIEAQWPNADTGFDPVFTDGRQLQHIEVLANRGIFPSISEWHSEEATGFTPNPDGKTYWQAIVEALAEELRRDPDVFMLGEDIGGKYGNAFVILKSLLDEFGDRLLNTPIAESAIIGAATGAALLGKRPIAEIQFNDFVASGFNQLVNNTAKIFGRLGHPVPLTIRLPWGGLRCAGPYHSQNTEAWFYRTPGLKIVCPSTPREAKGLLKAAIRDDNPVLFYEHIALYRAPHVKELLPSTDENFILPIGKAHLKRAGTDLSIITYGAYVHRCLKAAQQLQNSGISCRVLDLRSLQPLDKQAILWCVQETNRVLIVHEDSKTGGIGQSIAAIVMEEAFEFLDAPVRVLGALDLSVPYSPPLENKFLVSVEQIIETCRLLAEY